MNERYTVAADIGSIRIENSDVVFYFENGMGDGGYTCTVTDRVPDRDSKWHFVGLFNVLRAGTTFLCDYDIGGEPLTISPPVAIMCITAMGIRASFWTRKSPSANSRLSNGRMSNVRLSE